MAKELRHKFFKYIDKHWHCKNSYDTNYKDVTNKSGVYAFVHFDYLNKTKEIVYIGSSTSLIDRYKNHKMPMKIYQLGKMSFSVFYFIEMDKGFYDYEMKLIRKLKPIFNKLTYGG